MTVSKHISIHYCQLLRFIKHLNGMIVSVIITLASMFPISCSSASDEWDAGLDNIIDLTQPLRVLVLGNSYSTDGLAYMSELVKGAELNQTQFCIYNGVISGGGISEWSDVCSSNQRKAFERKAGVMSMYSSGKVIDVIRQDWDVIAIMQSSDKSYSWTNFEGHIGRFIELLRQNCTNPNMRLVYVLPWGHTRDTAPKELAGNLECAQKLVKDYGLDIIPVGVAVQNARNTCLCNETYLTRDNWHLCHGVGRYVAACTWYEALLAPLSKVGILGNPTNHVLSKSEKMDDTSVAVDEVNRALCQKCAFYAIQDKWIVHDDLE